MVMMELTFSAIHINLFKDRVFIVQIAFYNREAGSLMCVDEWPLTVGRPWHFLVCFRPNH